MTGDQAAKAIQMAVCHQFDVTLADLRGKRKPRSISHPRAVAMYLCRERLTFSYEEIGLRFGGRDHSTVMSAVSKIGLRVANGDVELKADLHAIKLKLVARPTWASPQLPRHTEPETYTDMEVVEMWLKLPNLYRECLVINVTFEVVPTQMPIAVAKWNLHGLCNGYYRGKTMDMKEVYCGALKKVLEYAGKRRAAG